MEVSAAVRLLAFGLLASCLSGVLGVRLKIQLHKDYRMDKLLTSAGSCSDMTEVQRSSLTLYGRLNDLGPRVKFWKSSTASTDLRYLETIRVPGLSGGQTVGEVFDVLRKGGCLPFFIGGSVRDQFLDRTPNDADVEVDCSIVRLVQICTKNWGVYNCYNFPGSHVVHIGNTTVDRGLEAMDVGSTNSTFYSPVYKLEYSVDSMAYDTNGNDVIIDLTGTGTRDACNKLIRIPSIDDSMYSWNAWLNNTSGVLYRFWKLRVKGLQAFNNATQCFIVENTKIEIVELPQSFPAFYCHYVFNSKYDSKENKCRVSKEKCKSGLSNAENFNKFFALDLGGFWTNIVVPNFLPSLEDCRSLRLHNAV